ncbi:hypothetical protein RD110_18710 [Rhodoferax koreense]|uniref:Uncharacterized protein n=1 Tax=Rhodoferax koreensis TaxID=1842727 RepID=A0A1P8JZ03_9BURK|nr:phage regulatory CII family protein [Rhodoferax koreense]APW38986.1 hypothetical protein RD110_18710 [Rhodoferax koreense]
MSMNVLDAAFNTVNDYPGGAASLAPRIGKSGSTLAHEIKKQGSAKLGLEDAVKIMDMADNNAILEAMAEHRGCDVIPRLPDLDPASCTGKGLRLMFKEAGAFAEQVVEAEEDGRFTLNEIKAAERHWQRVTAQGGAVLRAMRAKHLLDFPDSSDPLISSGDAS